MSGKAMALLIFHQQEPFNEMMAALGKIAIPARRVQNLAEAKSALSKVNPPLLAITESHLPDGDWSDVVSISETASSRVNVIVVGPKIDTKLYASAIEVGAFDYIAPPFEASDLAHVVRCAVDNALSKRKTAENSKPAADQLIPIAIKSPGRA